MPLPLSIQPPHRHVTIGALATLLASSATALTAASVPLYPLFGLRADHVVAIAAIVSALAGTVAALGRSPLSHPLGDIMDQLKLAASNPLAKSLVSAAIDRVAADEASLLVQLQSENVKIADVLVKDAVAIIDSAADHVPFIGSALKGAVALEAPKIEAQLLAAAPTAEKGIADFLIARARAFVAAL